MKRCRAQDHAQTVDRTRAGEDVTATIRWQVTAHWLSDTSRPRTVTLLRRQPGWAPPWGTWSVPGAHAGCRLGRCPWYAGASTGPRPRFRAVGGAAV